MTTGAKIGLGLGAITAMAVIYFGFTEKGKQKWSVMFDPTKGGTKVPPRTAQTADDAKDAVMKGADGMDSTPRRPGVGSPFGSNGADGTLTKSTGAFPFVSTSKMKSAPRKAVIRGEVCEWNGSEWINCKKLQVA